MKRLIVFLYGLISYVFFLGVFLYAVGFVGNMIVPKSIDSGTAESQTTAMLINGLLLALFAVQHTIMARPAFKAKLTKIIPEAAERSTFVLATNICFVALFYYWQPMTTVVWSVDGMMATILSALFWIGWAIVLFSTFLIDHFELFGLKQIFTYLSGREFKPPTFKEHYLYKFVRHPIMLGFVIAFWAAPTMTAGHLFFTVMTTGYILVGVMFEERDLRKRHGVRYEEYANRVPMLIPFTKFGKPKPPTPETDLA